MGAGSAPGDVVTRLQVGEQVVTQQQRADARSGGGGPVAVLQIGHRTMEAVTMTQTDDPRSTLGKMSLSDNYGHRGFAGAK